MNPSNEQLREQIEDARRFALERMAVERHLGDPGAAEHYAAIDRLLMQFALLSDAQQDTLQGEHDLHGDYPYQECRNCGAWLGALPKGCAAIDAISDLTLPTPRKQGPLEYVQAVFNEIRTDAQGTRDRFTAGKLAGARAIYELLVTNGAGQ